jgi:hypothetical protein
MTDPDIMDAYDRADQKALAEAERKQQLDSIVGEYLDLAESAEKVEERRKEVADEIAKLLGPGGRHEVVKGVGVTVSRPARRWDAEQARKVLTPGQYQAICVSVPDRKQAEALLPGALVELCLVKGDRPIVRRI